jgi:hypothetical protein
MHVFRRLGLLWQALHGFRLISGKNVRVSSSGPPLASPPWLWAVFVQKCTFLSSRPGQFPHDPPPVAHVAVALIPRCSLGSPRVPRPRFPQDVPAWFPKHCSRKFRLGLPAQCLKKFASVCLLNALAQLSQSAFLFSPSVPQALLQKSSPRFAC